MRSKLDILFAVAAILGVVLLLINLAGFVIPLRATVIDEEYADFARSGTLAYQDAVQQLDKLGGEADEELFTEVTKIVHYGMAHISPEDVKRDGFDHYRMRIPVWENYLLFLLSYIKPDTYQDYEFCSHRKALERGTGRCGQQSLVLIGFLAERGIDTGFVHLGGHTLATAKADDGHWFMMDPDYGGVIPFGLSDVEGSPEMVLDYYWNNELRNRNGHLLFGPEGNYIDYGGPEVRWKRVCPLEQVAYILKWGIPLVLIAVWGGRRFLTRTRPL